MRKGLPDLLKGLAVLSMIQVHIMELFVRQGIFEGTIGSLSLFVGGPPAAPVFLIVMGYFLALKERPFLYFVKRGMLLILWGFLLNIGLNFHLFVKIYQGLYELNPLDYLLGVDIFFLAGMSILLISVLKYLFRGNGYLYFFLAVAIVFVTPKLPGFADDSWLKYIEAFLWGKQSWSYFPLFPWLAYPLTGFAFVCIEKLIFKDGLTYQNKLSIALPAGAVVFFTFSYGIKIAADLEHYYHHSFLYFGWTILFVSFWAIVLSFIEENGGRSKVVTYFKWVGKTVTTHYVFQWLIIGNIATAIYKTQGLGQYSLWFIGTVVATGLLVWFWRRLKGNQV
ncbi:MAG: DUF1624 domain-containing protein [Bacteroidales bacterium]|nr:DUF1624 domain-containing protein [Bacteroidales bacterium]